MQTLTIPHRFRGPADSGNGGWVAGQLARAFEGAATVRLHAPPPLETALAIRETDDAVEFLDGETLLARARPAALELEIPEPPGFDEALACEPGFQGFAVHPIPGCFVCGTEREVNDGLRIFAAPWKDEAGTPRVAAGWQPDASLADASGTVRPEILWAALDCPGAFSFTNPPGRHCLLGELTAKLEGEVHAGERCVVVGWSLGQEGRKRFTATAVFGEDGALRGASRATWIELAG